MSDAGAHGGAAAAKVAGPARARLRRLLETIGVISPAVLLIAALFVVKFAGDDSPLRADRYVVSVEGTYGISIEPGDSPLAADVWNRTDLHGTPVPWENVGIGLLRWAIRVDEGRHAGCDQALVILHPQQWQVSAISAGFLLMGEVRPYVDAIAAIHPDILGPAPDSGGPAQIAGTFLYAPLTQPVANFNADILWQVPTTALPPIRVVLAVFCAGELVSLRWLANA